jgi:predicted transposase/invertase (TIGR01784 family)
MHKNIEPLKVENNLETKNPLYLQINTVVMNIKLVRFDWAMKRLLRQKANFVVLEGFLSVLLNEKVLIKQILSSQSNKEDVDDKYNDVDILVENSKGELIIIEIQNSKEYDYFQRILYGTSKVAVEYLGEGQKYSEVKKIISVTIAYFDLGQGDDYVYHGTTSFKGIHKGDILTLSSKQKERSRKEEVSDIYPEYWIIKAGVFDEKNVNDKLDEWIYFFKTGEVLSKFTAEGLPEAMITLDKLKLSPDERRAYEEYLHRVRREGSFEETKLEDAKELALEKEKAKDEGKAEMIIEMHNDGLSVERIAKIAKISVEKVREIIEKYA